MESKLHQIARITHEVNRAYCAALGDHSQPTWEDAPDWQRESALKGVQFHLDNPGASPEASHDAWLAAKRNTGWHYGPIKDPAKKEHPCCMPFADLPKEQQVKDHLFRAVVHAACACGLL
jgi:RyR domain